MCYMVSCVLVIVVIHKVKLEISSTVWVMHFLESYMAIEVKC